MRRGFSICVVLAAMAACGAKSEGEMTQFSIKSSAFADGQALPAEFTCDGADQSPPLQWFAPPSGTKSFALVVDDPDAPRGTFRHWGAFNIPAVARELAPGAGNQDEGLMVQARNDFGKPGYGGACPPPGHGPHHYRFKLMALDVDRLAVGNGASIKDIETAAEKHLVGRAELTGIYERK
ncbi:MAG TPA: YbhB/YbcL family Raf kinase inhibitor-like protein [Sphingomicrobium sp.]|nr:YbhB/YbcL family Raf kinase inhibitor-like protein [Sphingomicrobium sp.]